MTLLAMIITIISIGLIAAGLLLNEWTSGNKALLARKSARRHQRWRMILKKYENSDGTPIVFDTDFYGNKRPANLIAGPFAQKDSIEKPLFDF